MSAIDVIRGALAGGRVPPVAGEDERQRQADEAPDDDDQEHRESHGADDIRRAVQPEERDGCSHRQAHDDRDRELLSAFCSRDSARKSRTRSGLARCGRRSAISAAGSRSTDSRSSAQRRAPMRAPIRILIRSGVSMLHFHAGTGAQESRFVRKAEHGQAAGPVALGVVEPAGVRAPAGRTYSSSSSCQGAGGCGPG